MGRNCNRSGFIGSLRNKDNLLSGVFLQNIIQVLACFERDATLVHLTGELHFRSADEEQGNTVDIVRKGRFTAYIVLIRSVSVGFVVSGLAKACTFTDAVQEDLSGICVFCNVVSAESLE